MRLRRLHIQGLRNINQPIDTGDIDADVVLVAGPNGSGKSSLIRAIRALLWPRSGAASREAMILSAQFSDARGTYTASRIGTDVGWKRDGVDGDAPALVDAEGGASYFFGIDDIVRRDDQTAQSIANKLARELSGGFDVNAARQQLLRAGQSPRTASQALKVTANTLREVTAAQQQVAQQELQLASLELDLAGATRALAQLEQVAALRQLGTLRGELTVVRAQLAGFPAGMSALHDGSATQIVTLQNDIAATEQRLTGAKAVLSEIDGTIAATRLIRTPEPAELHELDALVGEARKAADHELHAARDIFGSDYEPETADGHDAATVIAGAHVSEQQLRQANELYGEVVEHDVNVKAVKAQLALLEPAISDTEADIAEGEVDAARRTLLLLDQLLELPDLRGDAGTGDGQRGGRVQRLLLVAGLAFLVVGILAAVVFVAPLLVIAGVGAGLVISVLVFRAMASSATDDSIAVIQQRRHLLRQLADDDTNLEIDVNTSRRVLAHTRAQLATRIASGEAAHGLRQQNAARTTALTHTMREHVGEQSAICDRWSRLLSDVGVPDLPLEPHAVRMLSAACRLDAERDDRRAAADVLRDARNAIATLTAQLSAQLEPLIGSAAAGATQVAAFADLVADVHRWADRLEQAQSGRPKAAEQVTQCELELADQQARWRDLFTQLEIQVGDELELRARLERRVQFDLLQTRQTELTVQVAAGEELHAADPELAALEPEALDAVTADLTERAAQRESLEKRIGDIRVAVRTAMGGADITEAQHKYQASYDVLVGSLDNVLDAQSAEFMLGDVSQLEAATQPEVVRSLVDWFARFTHDRYALRVETSPAGDASFVATDTTSGSQVQLDELSTATRTQLLIAARVAWTEHLERTGAARLPWILDESLAATDPERFTSIIRGLFEAAGENGRQVWYLTSDNIELAKVADLAQQAGRSVQVIDVAALADDGQVLQLQNLPEVASSAAAELPSRTTGESYDAWGERCAVRLLDFAHGSETAHVWHLARDDDQLVQQLHTLHLNTAGQLQAAGRRGQVPGIAAHALDLLMQRCEMLTACVDGWRAGRGRPVRAVDVMAADLGSTKSHDIAELADQLHTASEDGCNGLDLLRALRGELPGVDKVSGLRSTVIEKLEQYLTDNGFIDERDRLDHDAIRLQALRHAGSMNLTEAGSLIDAWLRHAGVRVTTPQA